MHSELVDDQYRFEGISDRIVNLHKAAASGTPDEINALIGSGTHVDARDKSGLTPLMTAAFHERIDNISALLSAGADVEAKDEMRNSVLHLAGHRNGMECTEALVSAGADLNAIETHGRTLLHFACQFGSLECVNFYLAKGKSLEDVDKYTRTPLLIAAQYGEIEKLEALINAGSDFQALDCNASNLLLHAAENPNPEVLCFAMGMEFSVESRNIYGITPLLIAAGYDRTENVKILLDAGAYRKVQDRSNDTVLHWASYNASKETIKLLPLSKRFVNKFNLNRFSALSCAAIGNNRVAAKLMLESGADINSRDKLGRTPIFLAAELDNFEMVSFLMDANADTSIKGRDGLTALALIESKGINLGEHIKGSDSQDNPS